MNCCKYSTEIIKLTPKEGINEAKRLRNTHITSKKVTQAMDTSTLSVTVALLQREDCKIRVSGEINILLNIISNALHSSSKKVDAFVI